MKPKRLIPLLFFSLFILSCRTTTISERSFEEQSNSVKTLYELHKEGALSGNLEDLVGFGLAYETGDGIPLDYTEALLWYKKASSKGYPEAYFRIGSLYEKGFGVEKSNANALEWYLSSAINEYLPAIERLIALYEEGSEEQMKWIMKGVELEDSYSFYRFGRLVEPDDRDKALFYYRKATDSENPEVMVQIAILSMGKQMDFYNTEQSLKVLELGSRMDIPDAQLFLGWLNEFGGPIEQNTPKAMDYYEKASLHNNQMAIYNLSRLNKDGVRAESYFNQLNSDQYSYSYYQLLDYSQSIRDKEQLEILYRFKASQGDPEAYYKIGLLAGSDESLHWFWIAAQEGYVPAMSELGRSYIESTGEDQDLIEGTAWLMTAENLGYIEGRLKSADVLSTMSDDEKLDVSRRFTELYYSLPTGD